MPETKQDKSSVCGRKTHYDIERDLYICECFISELEKENG